MSADLDLKHSLEKKPLQHSSPSVSTNLTDSLKASLPPISEDQQGVAQQQQPPAKRGGTAPANPPTAPATGRSGRTPTAGRQGAHTPGESVAQRATRDSVARSALETRTLTLQDSLAEANVPRTDPEPIKINKSGNAGQISIGRESGEVLRSLRAHEQRFNYEFDPVKKELQILRKDGARSIPVGAPIPFDPETLGNSESRTLRLETARRIEETVRPTYRDAAQQLINRGPRVQVGGAASAAKSPGSESSSGSNTDTSHTGPDSGRRNGVNLGGIVKGAAAGGAVGGPVGAIAGAVVGEKGLRAVGRFLGGGRSASADRPLDSDYSLTLPDSSRISVPKESATARALFQAQQLAEKFPGAIEVAAVERGERRDKKLGIEIRVNEEAITNSYAKRKRGEAPPPNAGVFVDAGRAEGSLGSLASGKALTRLEDLTTAENISRLVDSTQIRVDGLKPKK